MSIEKPQHGWIPADSCPSIFPPNILERLGEGMEIKRAYLLSDRSKRAKNITDICLDLAGYQCSTDYFSVIHRLGFIAPTIKEKGKKEKHFLIIGVKPGTASDVANMLVSDFINKVNLNFEKVGKAPLSIPVL